MRKVIVLCMVFFSVCVAAAAQTADAKKDSLLRLLKTSRQDTNTCLQLTSLAIVYQMSNQDSSQYYLDRLKELSQKLQFTRGMYSYYEQSVVLDFTKGDYNAAILHSDSTIQFARRLKDSALVAAAVANLGITYNYLGKYNDAIDAILKSKNIYEAIGDSSKLSPVYHNLANCYQFNYLYRKALDNALISIKIHEQYDKPNRYINRVYSTAAQSWQALGNYDSALRYYKAAIDKSIPNNDKIAEATIYGYLVDLYGLQTNFSGMLAAGRSSYAIATELQSRQMQASALSKLAVAYLYNSNLKEAKRNVDSALAISKADSLMFELFESYTALAYISVADGDYATAFSAQHLADSIQQKTLNDEVVKTTADLEKKYETEKKESQIRQQQDELKQKSFINGILIGSAGLLLLILVLSYRNYRHRRKLQQQRISELETEKQLTATEAVLKGEEQERTRLAKDLHDGLGGMLSGIKYSLHNMKGNLIMTPDNAQAFERSIDMLDTSIQEMRRVAHNMMPEALVKFGLDAALRDFCNDISRSGALTVHYQSLGIQDAALPQTTAITLYRIVQELVNNVLKHAHARTLIVQVSKTDGKMSITVEDDGKGFDTAVLRGANGIGWSNIRSRVEYVKGTLDVQSEQGKGTSVHIELPSGL